MDKAIITTFKGYSVRCRKCGKVKPKEEFSSHGIAYRTCKECMMRTQNL